METKVSSHVWFEPTTLIAAEKGVNTGFFYIELKKILSYKLKEVTYGMHV